MPCSSACGIALPRCAGDDLSPGDAMDGRGAHRADGEEEDGARAQRSTGEDVQRSTGKGEEDGGGE
eukprot:6200055-Pleurochrysis_carterae.AAC.3